MAAPGRGGESPTRATWVQSASRIPSVGVTHSALYSIKAVIYGHLVLPLIRQFIFLGSPSKQAGRRLALFHLSTYFPQAVPVFPS